MFKKDIAVVGISCKFPEADNLNEFYENLKQGKDSIRDIPESRLKYSAIDGLLDYKINLRK